MLDLSRRRRFTPGPAARVDWSHPLAQGLAFAAGPWCGYRDLVRGITPTSGAPARTVSQFGEASTNTTGAAPTYSATATSHLNFTGAGFSVMAVGAAASFASYPILIGRSAYTNESNNNGWLLVLRADSDSKPGLTMQCQANNAVSAYAASNSGSGVVALNVPAVLIGVNSSSTVSSWLNGKRVGNSGSGLSPGTSSASLVIGGNDTHTGSFYAVWSRDLSANEIAALAADPFAMLRTRG